MESKIYLSRRAGIRDYNDSYDSVAFNLYMVEGQKTLNSFQVEETISTIYKLTFQNGAVSITGGLWRHDVEGARFSL